MAWEDCCRTCQVWLRGEPPAHPGGFCSRECRNAHLYIDSAALAAAVAHEDLMAARLVVAAFLRQPILAPGDCERFRTLHTRLSCILRALPPGRHARAAAKLLAELYRRWQYAWG